MHPRLFLSLCEYCRITITVGFKRESNLAIKDNWVENQSKGQNQSLSLLHMKIVTRDFEEFKQVHNFDILLQAENGYKLIMKFEYKGRVFGVDEIVFVELVLSQERVMF